MKGRYRIFFVLLTNHRKSTSYDRQVRVRTTVDGGPAKSWIPLQYSDVEKNTIITDTTAGEWSSLLVVGSGISSSIISSTKEIDTSNSQKVSSSEDIILQEK